MRAIKEQDIFGCLAATLNLSLADVLSDTTLATLTGRAQLDACQIFDLAVELEIMCENELTINLDEISPSASGPELVRLVKAKLP